MAFMLAMLPFNASAYWVLVWNDEFNGTSLDTTKWVWDTGNNNGWGNEELEYYTGRTNNLSVSDGVLHITARKESMNGFSYTSGRIKSYSKFSRTYGRFEIRARLPKGLGFWPALWMLPADVSVYGPWPASGEIDIMENRGSELTKVQASVHYGAKTNHQSYTAFASFPSSNNTTNFHIYVLEWAADRISMYVDDKPYASVSSWWSSGGPFPAPFDTKFYILMNLAVGGTYVGSPSITTINNGTVFPGEMQVDYVRAYRYSDFAPPPLDITATSAGPGELQIFADNGPPRALCYVLFSTNPALPMTSWLRLTTNQFNGVGVLNTNIPAADQPGAYRLQIP